MPVVLSTAADEPHSRDRYCAECISEAIGPSEVGLRAYLLSWLIAERGRALCNPSVCAGSGQGCAPDRWAADRGVHRIATEEQERWVAHATGPKNPDMNRPLPGVDSGDQR